MIREGTRVRWPWGSGHGSGEVRERHESRVTRTFDETEVTREGDADDPALVIASDGGADVLKLQSEVEREDASEG